MRTLLERRAAAPERRSSGDVARIRTWEDLVYHYGWLLRIQVYRALLRAGLRAEREPVEDWVQEAFYRLFAGGPPRLRRLRSLEGAQLGAYLGRVASGVVLDERRSRAAVKRGK